MSQNSLVKKTTLGTKEVNLKKEQITRQEIKAYSTSLEEIFVRIVTCRGPKLSKTYKLCKEHGEYYVCENSGNA